MTLTRFLVGVSAMALMSFGVRAEFIEHWYGGFGYGPSSVKPESESGNPYRVSDNTSSGVRLHIGLPLGKRLAAELQYSDLGQADIALETNDNPDARVGGIHYFAPAAVATYKVWPKSWNYNLFGKYGLSFMQHEANGNIDYEEVNQAQVMFGIGGLWGASQHLQLRLDLDSFSRDAQHLAFSLQYQFGRNSKTLLERLDTQAGIPQINNSEVDRAIADIDQINVPNIEFETGSSELTDESQTIIEQLAVVLKKYPNISIQINAHTDNVGTEQFNEELALKRAESVKAAIISLGLSEARLITQGHGERLPIMDNATALGRAQNRRVEIKVFDSLDSTSDSRI